MGLASDIWNELGAIQEVIFTATNSDWIQNPVVAQNFRRIRKLLEGSSESAELGDSLGAITNNLFCRFVLSAESDWTDEKLSALMLAPEGELKETVLTNLAVLIRIFDALMAEASEPEPEPEPEPEAATAVSRTRGHVRAPSSHGGLASGLAGAGAGAGLSVDEFDDAALSPSSRPGAPALQLVSPGSLLLSPIYPTSNPDHAAVRRSASSSFSSVAEPSASDLETQAAQALHKVIEQLRELHDAVEFLAQLTGPGVAESQEASQKSRDLAVAAIARELEGLNDLANQEDSLLPQDGSSIDFRPIRWLHTMLNGQFKAIKTSLSAPGSADPVLGLITGMKEAVTPFLTYQEVSPRASGHERDDGEVDDDAYGGHQAAGGGAAWPGLVEHESVGGAGAVSGSAEPAALSGIAQEYSASEQALSSQLNESLSHRLWSGEVERASRVGMLARLQAAHSVFSQPSFPFSALTNALIVLGFNPGGTTPPPPASSPLVCFLQPSVNGFFAAFKALQSSSQVSNAEMDSGSVPVVERSALLMQKAQIPAVYFACQYGDQEALARQNLRVACKAFKANESERWHKDAYVVVDALEEALNDPAAQPGRIFQCLEQLMEGKPKKRIQYFGEVAEAYRAAATVPDEARVTPA